MAPVTILHLSRRTAFLLPRASASSTSRRFSLTPPRSYPRNSAQDRASIDTEANEYAKSGTDDGAATQDEAAFDPKTTSPEAEKEVAGKGNSENPLNVSPANPRVSKQTGQKEDSRDGEGREKQSGFGGGAKAG